ncbi:hypothetical protein HanHA89_Chr13g0534801 [Helianthus annuus]|nr:hypothetical protein HanHA89_Chr13g0534801 [Helianthus annuus]
MTLRFGGEDVSRCLLWTQRHHQTWPPIRTDALAKPIDLLMLNRLKESYSQIYVRSYKGSVNVLKCIVKILTLYILE